MSALPPEPSQPTRARVLLNVDRRRDAIQVSISVIGAEGSGHGYRIAGPKYLGDSTPVIEHELTARDVEEIRQYLALWDTIQAAKRDAS